MGVFKVVVKDGGDVQEGIADLRRPLLFLPRNAAEVQAAGEAVQEATPGNISRGAGQFSTFFAGLFLPFFLFFWLICN